MQQSDRQPYVEPTFEKTERLTDVTAGESVIVTGFEGA